MKDIKGLIIKDLGFSPMKLGDFLNYEGPLLSHFIDREKPDDNYFYSWVDFDETAHRWLISKFSEKDLIAFFTGETTLNSMIKSNNFVTLLDLDNDLNKVQIQIVPTSILPDNYLPIEDSYFKEDFYHKYATQLKQRLLEKQAALVEEQMLLKSLLQEVQSIKIQQTKTNGVLTVLADKLNIPYSSQMPL
jgi:hypothetical protein